VCGEVACYDAGAAAYFEDCGGGCYGGVDDAAFYQGDEGVVLVEEAGVLSCTGEGDGGQCVLSDEHNICELKVRN